MTEDEKVALWRSDQLERAGFTEQRAAAIADDPLVDVRQALELIEQGCGAELAVTLATRVV